MGPCPPARTPSATTSQGFASLPAKWGRCCSLRIVRIECNGLADTVHVPPDTLLTWPGRACRKFLVHSASWDPVLGLRWLPGTEPLGGHCRRGSWCAGASLGQRDNGRWQVNAPWRESLRGTHRTPAVSSAALGHLPISTPRPPTLTASLNNLPHKLPCSESAVGQTQPGTDGDSLALRRLTFTSAEPDLVESSQQHPGAGVGPWPGGGAGAGWGAAGGTAVVKLLSCVPGSASTFHPNVPDRVLQIRVLRSTH